MSPQPPMGAGIDDRRTPRDLFNRLHEQHRFTLDAAASDENALLPHYYTVETNGLVHPWNGERVFINPPYGRGLLAPFIEKAWCEVNEGGCHVVVALLPARTEQPWFHQFVYDKARCAWRRGVHVDFIEKRVKYDGLTTGAPFPSMIVTWA